MKSIILSIFLVVNFAHELQAQLDDYKYIVVPKIFNAFKQENQYKTSTLVKHLFTKKGFNVIYEDNLPEDLRANECLGLFVNIDDQSTLFTTKTTLELKDCSQVVVFSTIQGKSKKKEYEASYAEAIENAFFSINAMDSAALIVFRSSSFRLGRVKRLRVVTSSRQVAGGRIFRPSSAIRS